MPLKGTREASHANSWYEGNQRRLGEKLDEYLAQVQSEITLPTPGARAIIAPHAGYSYSGPCAAWAYKHLDLSKAKRIFILGPSHTYYLKGCALTKFAKYATPFGDLIVDGAVIEELHSTNKFSDITSQNDVAEHSLEMHLPYIYKRIQQTFKSPSEYPTIVPILVGDNNGPKEKEFGQLLSQYLKDSDNVFVVSSDFCHWGRRFSYTAYAPEGDVEKIKMLSSREPTPTKPKIHESIHLVDHRCMDAIAMQTHDDFLKELANTKNTVCGRHPIGLTMVALETLAKDGSSPEKHRFKFVNYERSSLVEDVDDSSVSYASAYAIV